MLIYGKWCENMLIYAKLGENQLIKAKLDKNIIYAKFAMIMQKSAN